jgi:hypothetical protein
VVCYTKTPFPYHNRIATHGFPLMRCVLFVLVFAGLLHAADDYPTHTIKSDKLTVTVYLPDAKKGFYRGTRFDHAGVCTIEFDGKKIFGPWKDKHNPANNDDIVGPVDEFGSMYTGPLNYKDAKVGETFLKIGVGELEKPKEDGYRFYHNYKIVTPGEWTIAKKDHLITFTQKMTAAGYNYNYSKVLLLDGATLRILHVLENTGKKTIDTDVYNHNFFNVDGTSSGKGDSIEFLFEPKDTKPSESSNTPTVLETNTLKFRSDLTVGSVMHELGGFDPKEMKHAGFTYKHAKSGLSVKASGDRPLSRFNVWAMKTTACPEPFHQLSIEPGKKATWTWKYDFAVSAK